MSNDSSSDANNPSSLLRNPFCPNPLPAFIQAQAEDWKELMGLKKEQQTKMVQQTLKPPPPPKTNIRQASPSPAPSVGPPPAPAAAATGGQSSEAAKEAPLPTAATGGQSSEADTEKYYLWESQIPPTLMGKSPAFPMQKSFYLWQHFALLTWCKTKEQEKFCKFICNIAFAASSKTPGHLWSEVGFLATLLNSLGIWKKDKSTGNTVISHVENLDIAAVSWAFAFFKKLKNQPFQNVVARMMEQIEQEDTKQLLHSGLQYLYKEWR